MDPPLTCVTVNSIHPEKTTTLALSRCLLVIKANITMTMVIATKPIQDPNRRGRRKKARLVFSPGFAFHTRMVAWRGRRGVVSTHAVRSTV